MNRSAITVLAPVLVSCMLLAACTGNLQSGDATGDLGAIDESSPGDLYVQLAVEYLRQGQTETALHKAKKALDVDSKNARAHNIIALIYQRLGQNDLAEKHFRTAVGLLPKDPYVLNAYASFLCVQRKFPEAEAQYKKALENPLYSTPWVARTNMGVCAKRSGNNGKAESYYNDALRANPSFGPALAALADLQYARGSYKSAKSYLDRYFKVAQPTPQVLLLAVRVERKLGSRKRARSYAQMLTKSYPGSYEALQL